MNQEAKYVIIRRRHDESSDSDEYEVAGDAFGVDKAREFALELPGDPGDILTVIDSAYVTNISRFTEGLFCVNSEGKSIELSQPGQKAKSSSWQLLVWEEKGYYSADTMIDLIEEHWKYWKNPDFDMLIDLAISSAKYCLKGIHAHNEFSAGIVEKMEGYVSGKYDKYEVANAYSETHGIYSGNAETAIDSFCMFVIDREIHHLHDGMYYAANSYKLNPHDLSEIVRSYIPLRYILLLMADSKSRTQAE